MRIFTDLAFIDLNVFVMLPGIQVWRISYGKEMNLNNMRNWRYGHSERVVRRLALCPLAVTP